MIKTNVERENEMSNSLDLEMIYHIVTLSEMEEISRNLWFLLMFCENVNSKYLIKSYDENCNEILTKEFINEKLEESNKSIEKLDCKEPFSVKEEKLIYDGEIEILKGKSAIFRKCDKEIGIFYLQFDDINLEYQGIKYAYGWHKFLKSELKRQITFLMNIE